MTRNDFFYKFIRTIVYPCFHAIYRIRIQGQENIPPEGPGVLVPKHQFWTDIPIVALTAWRPVNYIAKQELFTYWGVRHFLSLLGAIPLDRLVSHRMGLDDILRAFELMVSGEALRVVLIP